MRKLLLASLALCLFAVSALAQSSTGGLVGTVSTADGAVAGANVTIKDNQTGRERTVVSSAEGTFSVSQLEVGTYTVTISAPGFKTFNASEVKIDVGREYSLNMTLEPGNISESVTVVAGADTLNTTNAELSNTVSQRQITELPLNGRNPLALITLQAGTSSNGATSTSINGQRSSFTNITRDGINIQDNFIRANASDFAPQRPGVDDISEFTLTTSNAGAESGYGASQVQLVTPRGQSEFHGAAFIFNRNSEFSSRPFFSNVVPFLNRNQFGGKVGGPLPLPRFGEGGPSTYRDKGFFFVTYEGFLQRQQSSALKTILQPQARTGVFTYNAACTASGANRCPAGITPGQQLSINLLSAFGSRFGVSGVNPLVQSRILDLIPSAGNTTDTGDQLNTTGFRLNVANNVDRDNLTMRFDVEANERNSFNLVYAYGTETNDRPDIASGFTVAPLVVQPATRNFLAAGWRFTPAASFTNEVRGGFFTSEPIFNPVVAPTGFTLTLPLISSPESTFQEQGRKSENYTLADNATYIRGDHSLRFGGSVTAFRTNSFASFDVVPRLSLQLNAVTGALAAGDFPGLISAGQLGTANGLLALLGGVAGRVDQTFNANRAEGFNPGATNRQLLDFENYGVYFADQWRVNQRLTLNIGMRYELYTALRERNGNALEPVIGNNPVISSLLNPNGTVDFIGTNGGGNRFYKTDKNNFAPVVSFAWSPQFGNNFLGTVFGKEGRTVIRGGYRISYVNDEFVRGPDNAQGGNAGLSTSRAFLTNDRLGSPGFVVPEPSFTVPRTFAQGNALSGINFGTVFAIDPNLKVPMSQEYNIGIQRELGFQTALEIRYVGGKADNLVRGIDLNEADIFGNGFLADFNRARSNLVTFGNPACSAAQAAATGCQLLTVFPNLGAGGLLANGTIRGLIQAGSPADLVTTYITNGLAGNVRFLPNPNAGPVDLLTNAGKYRYNSLQVELRRRFTQGFHLQANYTFQKTLTNASGVGQTRFEPNLTNLIPELEYSRADYDSTHVFNFNTIYELPFGRGKRFLNEGGVIDRIFGGFQFTSIVRISTGAPITIVDPRGTFARRSGRQTAVTALGKNEIKDLIGIFRTQCGVFFINPAVIDLNQTALAAGQCGQLNTGGATGRGARGFGEATFAGQVFFNNAPGQTSGLERAFINGPMFINWDASLIKNVRLTENTRIQLRMEAFNVLNRANFFASQLGNLNINSTNFGRISSTFTSSGAQRVIQFGARFEF
ncbi:MAG: TonB-dependent receptor [Acidobacteria bacterium]|nr:TonB-dependent receptor [Acidobacteriota bacterium]